MTDSVAHHVMTGFYVFSNPMTDEWRLGGAVNQGYKLILIVFGKVCVIHLQAKKYFLIIFSTLLSLYQMKTLEQPHVIIETK